MKILLTGATGFIGSHLSARLVRAGHEVVSVSRKAGAEVDWSEKSLRGGVERADAIVHLAGENLFAKRWTAKQKERLRSSRIETTARLARLAAETRTQPLVCASAIGYYGPSDERGLTESAPPGSDYLADVCRDWEANAAPARDAGMRTAHVRIGLVLGEGGGALAKMVPLFELGLGGPLGSGRQWVSWIHVGDLARLFQKVVEDGDAEGPVNGTAPNPVTMKELARTLGRVLGRPAVLPAPGFALRIALGEVAGVMTEGQHVVPAKARELGFEFDHPELEGALRDVLGR